MASTFIACTSGSRWKVFAVFWRCAGQRASSFTGWHVVGDLFFFLSLFFLLLSKFTLTIQTFIIVLSFTNILTLVLIFLFLILVLDSFVKFRFVYNIYLWSFVGPSSWPELWVYNVSSGWLKMLCFIIFFSISSFNIKLSWNSIL